LANELIAHGWRLKHIHKLILMSRTFQQSSAMNTAGYQTDSNARLLWRFPPRRLEAEAIRDAILATSGQLDLSMGGPGFDLFEPNDNYVKVYTTKAECGPTSFAGWSIRASRARCLTISSAPSIVRMRATASQAHRIDHAAASVEFAQQPLRLATGGFPRATAP